MSWILPNISRLLHTLVIRLPLSSTECMDTVFAGPGSQARASRTGGSWSAAVTGSTTVSCSHYTLVWIWQSMSRNHGKNFSVGAHLGWWSQPGVPKKAFCFQLWPHHPVTLARSMFSSALLPHLWDWITLPVLPSPRGGTITRPRGWQVLQAFKLLPEGEGLVSSRNRYVTMWKNGFHSHWCVPSPSSSLSPHNSPRSLIILLHQ